jgi:O-acetyl-ADP-ribose deacetylase (regulator of RNase III)
MVSETPQRIVVGVEDILQVEAHALVVPSDSSLSRRDGIAGTIHRAAGRELIAHCRQVGPCAEGDAVLTPGFCLKVPFLIHVVLPQGSKTHDDLIRVRKAYWEILHLCEKNSIEIVAIPPVPLSSTGLSPTQVAYLALDTVERCLVHQELPRQVRFCCATNKELRAYKKARSKLNALETKENASSRETQEPTA